eukprot:TRINITY_DN3899_c0_g1_i1.p1 TRINITY_DN3899_c0_g1~~TRINITY_DN3899_c0_g1_i1.p1  ORF type:complete len:368 (-),score=66.66 TRINITY_DN3899_c0_g1_i1:32-1135(-)
MKAQIKLVSTFVLCFACLCSNATLYAIFDNGLISLDPQTGEFSKVCPNLSVKALQSSNGCSSSPANVIYFYTSDDKNENKYYNHKITDLLGEKDDFPDCMKAKGNSCDMSFDGSASSPLPQLVSLNVSTCKITPITIDGLGNGQTTVADMKFNEVSEALYMVFPNPNCIHGSLDSVNQKNGHIITHLADITDSNGLNYRSAISSQTGNYYSLEFEIMQELGYGLSAVDLTTMNQTLISLVNNTIGLGEGDYTLDVWDLTTNPKIIGFASASGNDNDYGNFKKGQPSGCTPSGFYNVDIASGNVVCVGGSVNGQVVPLADFDRVNQLYYQVIDSGRSHYLITYDVSSNTILYNVECKVCKSLRTLNFV